MPGVTLSAPALAAIIAGTATATGPRVSFANSNGVSFGVSGNTVTATVIPGAAAGIGALVAGSQTATSGTIAFVNSNGLTFGMSGSTAVTGSYTVPTVTNSSATISAGTQSATLSNLVFSNSNGLSFGLDAGTITGSYTVPNVPAQTVQTQNVVVPSGSNTTYTSGTVVFTGSNAVTIRTTTGQAIVVDAPVQTVQTQSNVQGISAGTQVGRTGDIVFSNSNGFTFGMSGSNTVTASYTVPSTAGLISAINVSGGTTSNNLTAVTFSNSNNVSFGLNGSTLTASASYSQSTAPGAFAAGTQTATSGTLVLSDSNGISFGMSGSTRITASYTVPSTAGLISAINLSAGTTSNNASAFTLSNSNGLTFGLNASTITASHNGLTAGIQSISAGTTRATAGEVVFSNSNGISFGMNAGTITATVNPGAAAGIAAIQGGTQTATSGTVVYSNSNNISFGLSGSSRMTASYAFNASAGTTSNDLNALTFSNANGVSFGLNASTITASVSQSNQTVGLYALGNTTQNSSTTLDARTLSFNALGAATVGFSNGSVQVSVPVQTAQTQSNIQAIYDGANSISTGTVRYTNANGVSFSVNGQTLSASIAPRSVRQLAQPEVPWQTNFSISNASFSLQYFAPRADITATQANLLMALSGSSGSSGALTVSMGIYTMNASTISLASSDSRVISWTSGSQTTASTRYGGVSGTMYRTVPLASWNITAGNYLLGMWYRTTNDGTWRAFGQQGPTIVNGIDANETNHYLHGFSTSSFTTAMVASINVTDTNYVRTGGNALQQPGIVFLGSF